MRKRNINAQGRRCGVFVMDFAASGKSDTCENKISRYTSLLLIQRGVFSNIFCTKINERGQLTERLRISNNMYTYACIYVLFKATHDV